jgi:hypothetical protein
MSGVRNQGEGMRVKACDRFTDYEAEGDPNRQYQSAAG